MKDNIQHLYHVIKDGKSGFINNKGQVVIDFEFDGASSFSQGLARIFVNDKVGFIDTDGNIVIPPKFESALGFKDGLAVVTINGKQGFIDLKGDIIIEPIFYKANNFKNGIALVMKDITSTGCFIDKEGKIILKGRHYFVSKYSEGLINCSENDSWGYVDLDEKFIIPPTYKYAREFSEDKAAVSPKKINGKPNRKDIYGFINKQNEMIIEPVYQGADIRFSEGLCAVWDNGYGYINDIGELTIPCDFEIGQHFNESLAVFKPKGKKKKYGYIDKKGNVAVEAIFTSANGFENGLASVVIGEDYENFKYGFIDKNGDYIWEPTK